MILLVSMRNSIGARIAKEVPSVRDWIAFAVPGGQVVYRGRYYFTWSRGRFVGAYDTLDDAVESLAFRTKNTPDWWAFPHSCQDHG